MSALVLDAGTFWRWIEATAKLIAQGVDLKLVLAGDGEMRGTLEKLIAHQGLGDRIHITGWISGHEVREEILAARALVEFVERLALENGVTQTLETA